jgi:hypothetical protein
MKKEATLLAILWSAVADADGYDVFVGKLTDLLASQGDFTQLEDCLAEDQPGTSYEGPLNTSPDSEFHLVRAVNCGGNGTADTTGSGQVESRDGEIASSNTCQ